MKVFKTSGSTDTTDEVAEIQLVFKENVDYVALAGFLNDHHITYQFHFRNVSGNVWEAVLRRTGEQTRWIPSIEVLGFQE
ncbi:hypothetical protein H6F43_03690 [Leptolyngbya sp. FACHB-36]|uniref:hypothetical protein n=1 Tax=Leptolyngbya sp. FACHB-36 TaxID=2692808 RepID=UPI001680DCBC|nr:hypothetical protein [Leptolyngbya sp. FACHB-36]MBD2019284.1 hypothetical protein [Leptolyngbya sp. FACHB-36]